MIKYYICFKSDKLSNQFSCANIHLFHVIHINGEIKLNTPDFP